MSDTSFPPPLPSPKAATPAACDMLLAHDVDCNITAAKYLLEISEFTSVTVSISAELELYFLSKGLRINTCLTLNLCTRSDKVPRTSKISESPTRHGEGLGKMRVLISKKISFEKGISSNQQ